MSDPSPPTSENGRLDHLPLDLQERIRDEVPSDQVRSVAAYDLSEEGRYVQGYLVLGADRLGSFVLSDGRWCGEWFPAGRFDQSKIVEGLGMSLLRLVADGKVLTEFRFTLRHAKEVARLHRRLERMLSGGEEGQEQEPPEPPRDDERKLRCDKCGRVIPPWAETCPACMSRRKVLFRLLDFVRPYRTRAIGGAALAIGLTLASLAMPWLTRPMLDVGLGAGTGKPHLGVFLALVSAMASLTLLIAAGHGLQSRLMAGLGSRVARNVRDTAYEHLHKLSLSFFSRKQTGNLVTRVTNDSDRLWDFIAFTIVEVSVALLTIAGVGAALFLMNWKLACFVLLPIPFMIALTVFFHQKLHRFFFRLHHRWGQMTAVVADALPGVRVIKAFSQEKREVGRFRRRNQQLYEEEMKMIGTWTVFGPIMMFFTHVGTIVIWLLGGYWVIRDWGQPGGMTVGTLMAFIGYMGMFYRPIHMIAHMDRMFNRAATSAQRIFEVLDTEPAIFSKTGAAQAGNVRGRIELRNVSFSYDGIRHVLKNVSLTIEPGEMVGLAGPSGGGKTTMVNLICRFYDPLEGQILIDGVDVRDYDLESLRKRIGVVLQEPFLFHGTIAENIAYGNPDATVDQILSAARAANAHDFIVGFPDAYDTMVGERGQTLSGGERQRISIARAILNNPSILILDEATSSVDTETEKLIQEALDRLIANRTTIAIAHRLSTLRKADRLVILEKGVIVEQGGHDQLARKEDGLYAKLLRMQNETQSIMAI
ncbi:MAG TPA: ABC transporter [Phycisphaerales bacterium]|nr:ABC transporter [Phycisphaerales bacterium]